MSRISKIRIALVALGAFCALAATGSDALAKSVNKRVELVAGKAATVELGSDVSDVLVANPSVVDVGTLRSSRLYLVGKTIGDTNVLAFDGNGNQLADISVHVKVDQASLSAAMREFFPDENIDVRTVNSNIVLSGTASTPLVANRVRDMASRFVGGQGQTIIDLMNVSGEQQVMLQVKVFEARRSVLREYGIETDYKPANIGGTGGNLNTSAGVGLAALQPFATGSLLFDDNGKFGPLRLSLQALERDGLINTLAEPNLTAISGETAGFLAGGEFPIPTGTSDNGNNVTIEFKQFGVSLNFTPTVLSEENISLHLATEVSAVATDRIVTFDGVDIPGLTVRRAETTVEMASGGSIMIAGLIQSGTADNFNSIPGIGKVPILGELFKSKSFQRDESELIIMVTPYLVKPFAAPRAEMASIETPSPVAQALKPALDMNDLERDRTVRDYPEARPIRRFNGQAEQRTHGIDVPKTPTGRTKGDGKSSETMPNSAPMQQPAPISTEPLPMKQGSLAPQPPVMPAAVEKVEQAAIDTPIRVTDEVKAEAKPQQKTQVQQQFKQSAAAQTADRPVVKPVAKVAVKPAPQEKKIAEVVEPAVPVKVEVQSASVPKASSTLSRHLVRNLRATYGNKADNAAKGEQTFGYLVD